MKEPADFYTPKYQSLDDFLLMGAILQRLDNPRHGWTLIALMLGYSQAETARIQGVQESTIHRFDIPAIRIAVQETKAQKLKK